jgi:hypothetical protein
MSSFRLLAGQKRPFNSSLQLNSCCSLFSVIYGVNIWGISSVTQFFCPLAAQDVYNPCPCDVSLCWLSLPGCATECEKERKRADAERLKSETDRKVREKVEQESLTLKEQLVQVLKRLDRVEDHQKADQSEIVRVHCMVCVMLGGSTCCVMPRYSMAGTFEFLFGCLL